MDLVIVKLGSEQEDNSRKFFPGKWGGIRVVVQLGAPLGNLDFCHTNVGTKVRDQ